MRKEARIDLLNQMLELLRGDVVLEFMPWVYYAAAPCSILHCNWLSGLVIYKVKALNGG